MAVSVQYDKVEWVSIGYDATHMIEINNVVSWADRVVSPDGDMVYPMEFVNLSSPSGVHHSHKYWEMEMVLDTTYLTDHTNPHQHWAYYLDVDDLAGVQPAIQCGVDPPLVQNYAIEWLKVYIREGDGSQTELVYAAEDPNTVWCIGETAEFNNEVGESRQTITYKFVCLGERGKTHDVAGTWTRAEGTHGYANEEPMKFMRIDEIDLGGANVATNIIRFEDDFAMYMTPQFLPNIFQGKDMKQDQRWRVLTVVLDSESTIFDAYIDIITANTVLPNFQVEFTLVDGPLWAAGTQQIWQYTGGTGNVSYMLSRREGNIHADVPRDTIEYRILTDCTRVMTTV